MKILVLYTNSEFPLRKNIEGFLNCFKNYSKARVYYCNLAIRRKVFFLSIIEYDLVIYAPSLAIPWNPENYLNRLSYLKDSGIKAKKKIAFFQDEYLRTDLMCKFISELSVNEVYSVAPKSEWPIIYKSIPSNVRIKDYLTGYVDDLDVNIYSSLRSNSERGIDIGYRTGWYSSGMYKLGSWGRLKFEIAHKFLNYNSPLNLDIKLGEGFLKGSNWFKFLSSCRYTIGVESGASLLDKDGSIVDSINSFLAKNQNASYEVVEENCFKDLDKNLKLKAISPRVFEAAMCNTGLVLIEGDYNGILKVWEHYIPLKEDFSNIEEVVELIKDESLRKKLVNNTYRDLIESKKYSYSNFVLRVLGGEIRAVKLSFIDSILYLLNNFLENLSLVLILVLEGIRKLRK